MPSSSYPLVLNSVTGSITVTSNEERGSLGDKWEFDVTVTDSLTFSGSTTTTQKITLFWVVDETRSDRKLKKSGDFKIVENSLDLFGTLQVDTTVSSVFYSIQSLVCQNPGSSKNLPVDLISVVETSGVVRPAQELDYELLPCETIEASFLSIVDGIYYSYLSVNLVIENANDIPPIFDFTNFLPVIIVPENTPVNTVILNVDALDQDSSWTLNILENSAFPNNPFTLRFSRQLTVSQSLSAFRGTFIQLSLLLSDGISQTSQPLKIVIQNINQIAPQCVQSSLPAYNVLTIEENLPPEFAVGAISISEREFDHEYFTFNQIDHFDAFSVDELSGVVFSRRSFDAEESKFFLINVQICDHVQQRPFYGTKVSSGIELNDSLCSICSQWIEIMNSDDNSPILVAEGSSLTDNEETSLTELSIGFEMGSNLDVDAFIGWINVSDVDVCNLKG